MAREQKRNPGGGWGAREGFSGRQTPKVAKEEQSWRRTSQAGSDGDTEHGQEAEDVMKF